ncbi:MAG TPA: hypothetical protein VH643_11685 [Gemmataceae bacterium]|jgi:hypothetical protein
MTTTAKTRKSRKPERRIRVLHPLSDSGAAVVAITVDNKEEVYAVRRIAADFGAAYHVIKGELVEEPDESLRLHDAAHYDLCLNGEQSTCECKGFLRWHHCKHVSGLTALRQRNLI